MDKIGNDNQIAKNPKLFEVEDYVKEYPDKLSSILTIQFQANLNIVPTTTHHRHRNV